MTTNLFDFLELEARLQQQNYFSAAHLTELFDQKIAKSRAVGKDGTRAAKFREIVASEVALIERKVQTQSYQFTSYREKLLVRGFDREPRQISIPTIRDRLTLRALCKLLHEHIPDSVGPPPHSLIANVVDLVRSGLSDHSFVRIDVKNFFPSILHSRIQKDLRRNNIEEPFIQLILKAIQNSTGNGGVANVRGIPQGLSISGALSAIYMQRVDKRHAAQNERFFRYVDDILIVCPTNFAHEKLKIVSRSLSNIGLKTHDLGVAGKTEIKDISEGIDFLGYHIATDKVSIRDASYQRMFKNVLRVITDYKYRRNQQKTAFRLNLKISGCLVDKQKRGWMMFFAQTEDFSQLAFLDQFVIKQLRRVGFPEGELPNIKTFIKSVHEIRFNLNETGYIPNFDTYTIQQKVDVICRLSGKLPEELDHLSDDEIDLEFSRLISREISDLEKDVGNPS